ncbi:MAG: hypothetical protein AMXMBFR7_50420 [Planctomycetota bacterium]
MLASGRRAPSPPAPLARAGTKPVRDERDKTAACADVRRVEPEIGRAIGSVFEVCGMTPETGRSAGRHVTQAS